jgi:hypothetical protein
MQLNRTTSTVFVLLISLALLGGCSSKQPEAGTRSGQGDQPPEARAASDVSPTGVETVTGTVVETMDASTYTYVRVKSGTREVWAASDHFPVAVGDTVEVPLETPMSDFHSQSLNRDFPLIYFTSHIVRPGEQQAPALAASHGQPAGMATGAVAGASAQAAAVPAEPVAPAPGGTTIAEVWARRKALAGSSVTVRGRVVKFNPEIMGRNWVHIQDGTGKQSDGTNDLTITTDAMVKVGDIITATGVVGVDMDFTAGYVYPVIVEKATVVLK